MNNKVLIETYLQKHHFASFNPKAALVDMDGTLYESMSHHARAWKMMADEAGLPSEEDEFYLYEGRTGASTLNILFNRTFGRDATEEEIKRLYGIKSRNFAQMDAVSPMPGAKELLNFLAKEGIERVLVTGSGQNTLISRLNADFPGAFNDDKRITAANTKRGKPHPDPYLMAMGLAGTQPWESIAFENAPLGVESASRAQAFTVAVSTGPIPKKCLAEAGADVVYDSMEECALKFPELLLEMKRII